MNPVFPFPFVLYMVFSVLSHIGASLFFAKPRYGKLPTALIWMIYAVVFLILPSDTATWSFFVSLGLHMVLFFITTTGRWAEKGFLFFSYATIHTCFSTLFNIVDYQTGNNAVKIIALLCLMALMQLLLYRLLLPSFHRVTPYIHQGWGKFHAVVLVFFALLVGQSIFPTRSPMTRKEIVIFLLTVAAFCLSYITVFISMKNIVQLSQEKRKQIRVELLQAQVDAQAKEAELVRQNRHDMRHHYEMLLSYARSGDLDKLTSYLERQTQGIEAMTTGRFCENETVNNILKVYNQKAARQGIAMEIRAAAKPKLTAADPDLVAIVANVLENALHGAARSGAEKPFIRVNIKHKSRHFVVRCENSCIPSLSFGEMPEELRGIGIHSIQSTAERYGGSCSFCAGDGVFCSMIVMDE